MGTFTQIPPLLTESTAALQLQTSEKSLLCVQETSWERKVLHNNNNKKPQSSLCEASLAVLGETLRGDGANRKKPKNKGDVLQLHNAEKGSPEVSEQPDWTGNTMTSSVDSQCWWLYLLFSALPEDVRDVCSSSRGCRQFHCTEKKRVHFGTRSRTQMAANCMISADSY